MSLRVLSAADVEAHLDGPACADAMQAAEFEDLLRHRGAERFQPVEQIGGNELSIGVAQLTVAAALRDGR